MATSTIKNEALGTFDRVNETFTDCNDITETGLYSISGAWLNHPFPDSVSSGNMIVIKGKSFTHQMVFYTNQKIYVRRRSGNSWNEWKSITLA